MNWRISIALSYLLMSCCGGLFVLAWNLMRRKLERCGCIDLCYRILVFGGVAFLLPAAGIALYVMDEVFLFYHGYMFEGSPFLAIVARAIRVLAIAGFLLTSAYLLYQRVSFRYLTRKRIPCDQRIMGIFREVCQRIGLDPRRIRLYTCYSLQCPVVTGCVRPVVILPEKAYSDEALGMILTHELTHVRQKAGWIRLLVRLVLLVQSINPAAWYFRRMILLYSELVCDRAACRQYTTHKQYYLLLGSLATGYNHFDGTIAASLTGEEKRLIERFQRAKENEIMKDGARKGRRMAIAMMLAFALLSTGTTAAIAEGFLWVADKTEVKIQLPPVEQPELKTMQGLPEGMMEMIDQGDGIQASMPNHLDWSVPKNVRRKSVEFYLSAGMNVTITGTVKPAGNSVDIGLINSSEQAICRTGSNFVNLSYSIPASGYYRVFCDNSNAQVITLSIDVNAYSMQ